MNNFSSERVDSKGLYGRWTLRVIGSCPLTIKIVSQDIGGTYYFDLGWVREWYSGQSFQVTGMIEVRFFPWFEIFRSEIFWEQTFF